MQRVLYHAARLVMKRSKPDHIITPLLKELHYGFLYGTEIRSRYPLTDESLPQNLTACLCAYHP